MVGGGGGHLLNGINIKCGDDSLCVCVLEECLPLDSFVKQTAVLER